jgi:hypothetical protein
MSAPRIQVLAARQVRVEWMRFAEGCHPNRDTLTAILAAGFEPETVEGGDLPGAKITRSGLSGVARKPV